MNVFEVPHEERRNNKKTWHLAVVAMPRTGLVACCSPKASPQQKKPNILVN
jgi:hypothetical protein